MVKGGSFCRGSTTVLERSPKTDKKSTHKGAKCLNKCVWLSKIRLHFLQAGEYEKVQSLIQRNTQNWYYTLEIQGSKVAYKNIRHVHVHHIQAMNSNCRCVVGGCSLQYICISVNQVFCREKSYRLNQDKQPMTKICYLWLSAGQSKK